MYEVSLNFLSKLTGCFLIIRRASDKEHTDQNTNNMLYRLISFKNTLKIHSEGLFLIIMKASFKEHTKQHTIDMLLTMV